MADRDRDEIIMSLTEIADQPTEDGMVDGVNQQTIRDALELLKEQKPSVPKRRKDEWFCNNCKELVGWTELGVFGFAPTQFNYCPGCGRKVAWDD